MRSTKFAPNQRSIGSLGEAYGGAFDLSNQVEGLKRIAAYMTDGNWVLAKIAAVQLRFPELPNRAALYRLVEAETQFLAKCRSHTDADEKSRKRDVSDEPRLPAGQTGGGQWTTGGESSAAPTNSLLIPAQAIAPPMPIPAPFELPMPPTGISPPLPLEIPGGIREPTPVNPYPDKPECVEEWAHAMAFCTDQQKKSKLKGGYGGFGKDFASCLRGMVSEACGGNPTA
jgi:hypothetical protein